MMMMTINNDSCRDDHDDENILVDYVRKASPPPFLVKTYMLVEDHVTDEVISWNGEGTAFVVWQPAEFSRDLLPTLFKHSNFSSFVRQLNTYGFRKVATNRWEFSNDMFRKGEREKLCEIRRRKAITTCSNNKPQPNTISAAAALEVLVPTHKILNSLDAEDDDQRSSSANSSSSDQVLLFQLMDDNKRLKQENEALCSELVVMKEKCKQLVDLVAVNNNHNLEQDQEECTVVDDHHYELDEEEKMINTTNEDYGPKLFGVRLMIKKRKLC